MPTPASVKVIVFAWSSVVTAIFSGRSGSKIRCAGCLEKLQLLGGIRGIGDQLADEDFLIGVKRVGDDLEQLPDLGLKSVFFRGRHGEGIW